jgi:hypothetical protein
MFRVSEKEDDLVEHQSDQGEYVRQMDSGVKRLKQASKLIGEKSQEDCSRRIIFDFDAAIAWHISNKMKF